MTRNVRQIRINGNKAYVPLTKGYEAIIDAADVPKVEGFNWRAKVTKKSIYAVRTSCASEGERSVYMHRIIIGDADGFEVDHIDRNGLNNRLSNLRKATVAQNQHNCAINANNSSGFKGIWRVKNTNRWRAKIRVFGEVKRLGSFGSPEEAYAAYCKASKKYHGEFSRVQ